MVTLRYRLGVTGQQVAAADGAGTRNVGASRYHRFGIAEQIRGVPGDLRERIRPRSHSDRRQVGHNQTTVIAPGNARAGQARVGIVAHEDALAVAARDDQIAARIAQGATV